MIKAKVFVTDLYSANRERETNRILACESPRKISNINTTCYHYFGFSCVKAVEFPFDVLGALVLKDNLLVES